MQPRPISAVRRPLSVFRDLLASGSGGGILLIAVAALALAVANSSLAPAYFGALETKAAGLSVLHWINDALMALFEAGKLHPPVVARYPLEDFAAAMTAARSGEVAGRIVIAMRG